MGSKNGTCLDSEWSTFVGISNGVQFSNSSISIDHFILRIYFYIKWYRLITIRKLYIRKQYIYHPKSELQNVRFSNVSKFSNGQISDPYCNKILTNKSAAKYNESKTSKCVDVNQCRENNNMCCLFWPAFGCGTVQTLYFKHFSHIFASLMKWWKIN